MNGRLTTLFNSWFSISAGLSYGRILKYFYPECITALIIYFLPYCIDCLFICNLKSTSTYAVSGIIDNFLTMFLKIAEAFPTGIVIIAGFFNGQKEYKKAGEAFVDAFWTVVGIGALLSTLLYFSVSLVCTFNKFSPEMVAQGVPYLRLKAVSIFFMFTYFSLVGFVRALKNTFVPMVVFGLGSILFVAVDYVLIFGKCGFPQMALMGSATASLVQYTFMCGVMLLYVLYAPSHRPYAIQLFSDSFSYQRIYDLFKVSLPVVIDKVSIAFAYAWLGSCMSQLGHQAGAAFACIKMMERFAFLPAIACSQVITFLVSNDLGKGSWDDITANIKRILIISGSFVGTILLIGSIWPLWFVQFFDVNGEFSYIVATIFPALSVLILIDLLQLILSGALRGAGDVKTVMWTRVVVISCFFIPGTYVIDCIPFDTIVYKMLVTYALFLIGNGLMSLVYIYRLSQDHWKINKKKAFNG
ncbi:MATE family efflux transporter [Candidatus Babeliales bacterium]|nr:MATE family efflux transporter [Candidatus Babeliales bacterium]